MMPKRRAKTDLTEPVAVFSVRHAVIPSGRKQEGGVSHVRGWVSVVYLNTERS